MQKLENRLLNSHEQLLSFEKIYKNRNSKTFELSESADSADMFQLFPELLSADLEVVFKALNV